MSATAIQRGVKVMTVQNCTLFEDLQNYSLDFLIPQHLTTDDDDEGVCHTFNNNIGLDPMDEAYYDVYFDDDSEEAMEIIEDDDIMYDLPDNTTASWNVDSLIRAFDCDYMGYAEFLNSHIWELFGVPKRQFDLIDWQEINDDNFSEFLESFKNTHAAFPIEKRIRYATVDALTNYYSKTLFNAMKREDYLEYARHLIDTHSIAECAEIFPILFDYYRFYSDAVEMNERRRAAGEATFNYNLTPKASHLRDLHDKASRDYTAMVTERLAKSNSSLDERIGDVSNSIDYKHFLYSNRTYIVKPVTCQGDLFREGEVLNHCVGSYGSKIADGECYIYFIRTIKDPDTPYFTAEIIPRQNSTIPAKLTQCYTHKDATVKPMQLREFIKEWARVKNFKVACKI